MEKQISISVQLVLVIALIGGVIVAVIAAITAMTVLTMRWARIVEIVEWREGRHDRAVARVRRQVHELAVHHAAASEATYAAREKDAFFKAHPRAQRTLVWSVTGSEYVSTRVKKIKGGWMITSPDGAVEYSYERPVVRNSR